jgi:carbon-monoxide dehydrogenase medium subunit
MVEAGALVTQRNVERSAQVMEAFPLMVEAIRRIGFPAIRTRGTLGGSLAHADPAGELPLVAVTVGAKLTLRSRTETRTIGADDFFVGHYTTARTPSELLVSSSWPTDWDTWGFSEFARRTGDFAIVAAAVVARLDGELVTRARVAVGGVAGRPVRLTEVEEALQGSPLAESNIESAADLAATLVDPIGDIHASPEFRRRLTTTQVRRALLEAAERVGRAGR